MQEILLRGDADFMFINDLLAHPLTKGLSLDDPQTTSIRRQIILEKPFLRKLYFDWYSHISKWIKSDSGRILEIGSGAGIFIEVQPSTIKSELFNCPNIDIVLDGTSLPVLDNSLSTIVMTDVLHHIPDCSSFFSEARRVLVPGGRIIMIEPWYTTWSGFVYTHLHHEPFNPQSPDWTIPSCDPLSGANGALPWILFDRDHDLFKKRFPELQLVHLELLMPFRYLVSGGVSMRNLMPCWSYPIWEIFEYLLSPFNSSLAMFSLIVLENNN